MITHIKRKMVTKRNNAKQKGKVSICSGQQTFERCFQSIPMQSQRFPFLPPFHVPREETFRFTNSTPIRRPSQFPEEGQKTVFSVKQCFVLISPNKNLSKCSRFHAPSYLLLSFGDIESITWHNKPFCSNLFGFIQ